MLNESLEQLIIKFLPEGKLIPNKSLELKKISKVIDRIFVAHDDSVIAESIFEIFYNLRYPMSVVEPIRKGEKLKPYINTNSHTIFIALDLEKFEDINRLSVILLENEPAIPHKLNDLYNSLQKFLTDINSSNKN